MPGEPLEEQIERARRSAAWRESKAFRRANIAYYLYASFGTIVAISIVLAELSVPSLSLPIVSPGQVAAILIAIIYMAIFVYFGRSHQRQRRHVFEDELLLEKYGQLGEQQAALLEQDNLKLGALWRLTEERLKLYHEIATRQAQASFRNAQWAIAGGFIVVTGSAFAAFFAKNVTITVVVGALGATGTALSAYIGRTFLRLQENSSAHLRSYFEQPQEQFRYLAAERLLERLRDDEQKAHSVEELIRAIVLPKEVSSD